MILESIPTSLVAGDTWRFLLAFADYPSPTWVVTLYFENEAATFNAAGSQSGTSHSFTFDAATTGALKAGRYRWRLRAVGSVTESFDDGWVEVLPNPAAAGTYDWRSTARKLLDAVEATLINKATEDQLSMSLAGRSIGRIPLPELLKWQADLRAEVNAQEGKGGGRYIHTRMVRG